MCTHKQSLQRAETLTQDGGKDWCTLFMSNAHKLFLNTQTQMCYYLIITSGCRHVHTTVTETRKIINLYNVRITIMPYLTDLNHFCHVNHRKALCDMHVYKRANCCALCKCVVIIISLIPHVPFKHWTNKTRFHKCLNVAIILTKPMTFISPS